MSSEITVQSTSVTYTFGWTRFLRLSPYPMSIVQRSSPTELHRQAHRNTPIGVATVVMYFDSTDIGERRRHCRP